jgi:hypothetical protein
VNTILTQIGTPAENLTSLPEYEELSTIEIESNKKRWEQFESEMKKPGFVKINFELLFINHFSELFQSI